MRDQSIISSTRLLICANSSQVDTLEKDDASMDNAKTTNLDNLEKIGNDLLKANVVRMNLDTSKYEPIPESVSNCQELER